MGQDIVLKSLHTGQHVTVAVFFSDALCWEAARHELYFPGFAATTH